MATLRILKDAGNIILICTEKDKSDPPKYIVFFKARDVDVMTGFKIIKVNLKKSQMKQSSVETVKGYGSCEEHEAA